MFLKSTWFFIPQVIAFLLFSYINRNVDDCIVLGILFIFFSVDDYRKYKKRESFLADLQQKGLTEEVAEQTAFARKWSLIEKKGMIYYCLIYSGLPLTVFFTALLGYLIFIIDMNRQVKIDFQGGFIISVLVGLTLGIALSRFLWSVNQKKSALLSNSSH